MSLRRPLAARSFFALFLGTIVSLIAPCFLRAEETKPNLGLGPTAEIQETGKRKISDEAQSFSKQAIAALNKGDVATARRHFKKVLELAPDNAPTLINLGLLEYRQKKYSEAETLLASATKTAPKSGLSWLVLGVVQYEQGKLEAALAALAMSAYLEPKDARTHHYLGVVVGSKGWYSAAEDEMRKAIELAPDYAEAHYNLAVFYLERNPPATELARRHYQKSVDLGGSPDPALEKKIEGK
jgi:Flp pilus assembly protein TadD